MKHMTGLAGAQLLVMSSYAVVDEAPAGSTSNSAKEVSDEDYGK